MKISEIFLFVVLASLNELSTLNSSIQLTANELVPGKTRKSDEIIEKKSVAIELYRM